MSANNLLQKDLPLSVCITDGIPYLRTNILMNFSTVSSASRVFSGITTKNRVA